MGKNSDIVAIKLLLKTPIFFLLVLSFKFFSFNFSCCNLKGNFKYYWRKVQIKRKSDVKSGDFEQKRKKNVGQNT